MRQTLRRTDHRDACVKANQGALGAAFDIVGQIARFFLRWFQLQDDFQLIPTKMHALFVLISYRVSQTTIAAVSAGSQEFPRPEDGGQGKIPSTKCPSANRLRQVRFYSGVSKTAWQDRNAGRSSAGLGIAVPE